MLKKGFYATREDQYIQQNLHCLRERRMQGDRNWLCCYRLPPKEFIERRKKYHFKLNFPSKRGKSHLKALGSLSRERMIF